MMRKNFRVYYNPERVQAKDSFNCIRLTKGDPTVLAGYLNSSVGQFVVELTSRAYTGMLELQTYELKQLPIIDVTKIKLNDVERISNAFNELPRTMESVASLEEELGKVKSKSINVRGLFEDEIRQKLDLAIKNEIKLNMAC